VRWRGRSYRRAGSILRAMPWWEQAVVYQIYPRSFQDSDGDGVGDLRGITQRLDHLVWLGVDAFWLSPFYPSPLADFGYDVSDYTSADPQFGSLDDFDELPAPEPFPLRLREVAATLQRLYSANRPEAFDALASIRAAAGDALLVGEVFQPTSEYPRYLEVLDLVFAFEFLFSPWKAKRLRAAVGPAAELGRVAWVMSNHDFERLATHVGPENLLAAARLLLALPGAAFVYQGDEIGLANGPGA